MYTLQVISAEKIRQVEPDTRCTEPALDIAINRQNTISLIRLVNKLFNCICSNQMDGAKVEPRISVIKGTFYKAIQIWLLFKVSKDVKAKYIGNYGDS